MRCFVTLVLSGQDEWSKTTNSVVLPHAFVILPLY